MDIKNNIYTNYLKTNQKKETLNLIYAAHNNEEKPKVWRKIPFIKETQVNVKKILEKDNIKPAFYNNKTLKNFLCNNKIKPKIEKVEKSGIYEVKCDDCTGIYIGKTKRQIKTRFKEHIAGACSENPQSGLSKHLKQLQHKTNINNVKLIHEENRGDILNKLEIYEIRKAKYVGKNIVNDQIDFTNTSPLLDPKNFS